MNQVRAGFRLLMRLIPAAMKQPAKVVQGQVFRRAISRVAGLPPGRVPDRALLEELRFGWDGAFAAKVDYLEEVCARAAVTPGPILECGSGLTTLLLGLLAGKRGVETWSLEHIPEWHTRVSDALENCRARHTHVRVSPLRNYGGFCWYDPPLEILPSSFGLVVCDGPPGNTFGGRYGLFPILGDRLPSGALILLDDAERVGEAEVLRRWEAEAELDVSIREGEIEGETTCFALVTRK